MAPTLRRVGILLSTIWLLALTILAAHALRTTHIYSLPISNGLCALTLALPPTAGLVIETSNAFATSLASSPKYTRSRSSTPIPPVLLPSTLSILALLVYQTVVATLAGTHIAPAYSLTCVLEEKWRGLFRRKDADAVRAVQDAFDCCGLRTVRDMAWPFADADHGADACAVRFERTDGCLEAWRGQEELVSGLMLAVAVGVFVWMVVIVATPALHPSALRRILHVQIKDENVNGTPRVIEYNGYRDDPEAAGGEDDDGDETSVRREIDTLNRESTMDSMIEGTRDRHSKLLDDTNRWRESSPRG